MRVFGLDIGTTSIGFAVVDLDEARGSGQILRMGARIFPEARDVDGTPLNQQRRAKRMMRRQLRRRRERRRSLNELLAAHGLLPAFGSPEWARVMAADPYALRNRGLAAPLAPHELGRALYHLSKRRHFKERDLAESEGERNDKEKPEEVEDAKSRDSFVAALRASGETLGQALARRDPVKARKRGELATRANVLDEFKRLADAQAPHHPMLRDRAFVGAVEEAIFEQRPVFWRKSTLGRCPLVPDAPLCPKGSWLSQQRRMLEKVNNLAIAGGNARHLDSEERAAILDTLSAQKSMSWGGVRKALKPIFEARGESERNVHFNLEYGDERGGLKGNLVEAELAKVFGDAWANHPRQQALRDFLPDSLWQCDYGEIGAQRVVIRPELDRARRRAVLVDRLTADFGVSREQAEALTKLHFPQGWEPYSTKALERILPELEKGERFGTLLASPDKEAWRDAEFPNRDRPTGEILDKLPSPSPRNRDEEQRIASLRNPTVVRVQNEMRKVVNNLIGLYGKPDLIRVELAREIGLSKREREERTSGMRARERERKAADADLKAQGVADPSGEDIEKWLLWRECGETCPYSGDKIGFDDLFKRGRFQIEHIWPRSKSLDDSFANKTLCRVDVNKDKGDRTPREYFRGRDDDWAAAKDRIWKMVGAKGMRSGKAKRFSAESMPDGFAARQINDTGYASRQARAMLQRLWPDVGPTAEVKVQAVTGRVTAKLRKLWGLNHILGDDGEKNRADHRHHAVDALVVACAHGGYINKLSHYFEADDLHRRGLGPKPSFEAERPWESIRQDAKTAADAVVVSHRVRKKVSGPLHLETIYGDTGVDETKGRAAYRLFVTRKPLERLTKGEIERIVDDRVRSIVKDWVAANGGDPKKAFAKDFPRVGAEGPPIRKVRLRMPQQIDLMAPVSTGFADRGENHHVAIWRRADGAVGSEVVSLFEASRRLARKEPIVRRPNGDGETFLMSLSRGDALQFPDGKMQGVWIVQGVWASGQIVLWRANDALGASVTRPVVNSIVTAGAKKISVDPIGRVRPAND
ncbi:MAG: type II CRISPR RNA-guided endonuclease Cas9 [Roseiarcus sp.]